MAAGTLTDVGRKFVTKGCKGDAAHKVAMFELWLQADANKQQLQRAFDSLSRAAAYPTGASAPLANLGPGFAGLASPTTNIPSPAAAGGTGSPPVIPDHVKLAHNEAEAKRNPGAKAAAFLSAIKPIVASIKKRTCACLLSAVCCRCVLICMCCRCSRGYARNADKDKESTTRSC